MDSAKLSMASWNYFHPTIYPDAAETNCFKKFSLGAIKVISYLTVVIPLIMLAVHKRATSLALGDKSVYKLPIFEQDQNIVRLANKHLSGASALKETNSPVAPSFVETTSIKNLHLNDDERDEQEFIDAILGDKELHKTVERIVTNVQDINESVNLIVAEYSKYRKVNELAELDENQEIHLLKFMAQQIQGFHKPSVESTKAPSKGEVPFKKQKLDDRYTLRIYNTNGNGSCGIHALVGKPVRGQYLADGAEVRRNFCDKLRKHRRDSALPEPIKRVLKDYLDSSGNAPAAFSNNKNVVGARKELDGLRQDLGELRKERQKALADQVQQEKSAIRERISVKKGKLEKQGKSEKEIEQNKELQAIKQELKDYQLIVAENPQIADLERTLEARIEEFIYDENIFEAYLSCLQKVDQYLLQDELATIADSLDKRVVLLQPGWGSDRDKIQYAEITVEGMKPIDLKDVPAENIVCIYYNGFNHYEKAEVIF